jgi:hypothetical protein
MLSQIAELWLLLNRRCLKRLPASSLRCPNAMGKVIEAGVLRVKYKRMLYAGKTILECGNPLPLLTLNLVD